MTETSTRTVDRALALLGVVCGRNQTTLADAARDAELSASTALRLLRTLEAHEFVRRDPDGRYGPGPRVVQLGALALANESLVSLSQAPMARVVDESGESCYLAVRGAGETALYIAVLEGTHSVRHANWVGHSIPLAGSAVGRVLAGTSGPKGYVVVKDGIESDVTAVSAPVAIGGRIVAALSCVVPTYRINETGAARIGNLLTREARSILPALQAPTTVSGGRES